jgi:hypothetical protein
MTIFKSISKAAGACGLTLLAASFAYAQGPTAVTGSTDIYTTDFQKTFATGSEVPRQPSAQTGTGSTDIYRTDFQTVFATDKSTRGEPEMADYRGSTDIWTTNFQATFM